MVWANFDSDMSEAKTNAIVSKRLAAPSDRFGAALIDLLISYSLSSLLSAPLQRDYSLAQSLGELGPSLWYLLWIAIVHIGVFVLLQSFLMFRFGRSLGQRFFGVRVIHLWTGKTLPFGKQLVRCLGFVCSLFLLMPLAALFHDVYRRMFYEKLTDSLSISESSSFALSPSRQEQSFIRGLLLPAYLWIFVLVFSAFSGLANFLLEEESLLGSLVAGESRCEEIDKQLVSWSRADEGALSRLNVALSLYATDNIDKDCLLKELGPEKRSAAILPEVYLAKALVFASSQELSDRYLEETCAEQKESVACNVAQWLVAFADEDHEKASDLVTKMENSQIGYAKIYALKHHSQQKNYPQVYRLLTSMSDNLALQSTMVGERLQSLWALGRQAEAEASFYAIKARLPLRERQQQQAWLCWKALSTSCESADKPLCESLEDSIKPDTREKLSEIEALALLKQKECSGDTQRIALLGQMHFQVQGSLRRFLSILAQEKPLASLELLSGDHPTSLSASLGYEIIDRVLRKENSSVVLEKLATYIKTSDPLMPDWESASVRLLRAYTQTMPSAASQSLAEELLAKLPGRSWFHRQLLWASSQHADRTWLQSFAAPLRPATRAPASERGQPKILSDSTYWQEQLFLDGLGP